MSFLNGIVDIMKDAQDNAICGEFMRAASFLGQMRGSAREEMQASTSTKVSELIKRLEADASLTEDDIKYMKLWIVGDAQGYLKVENNLDDWIKEFDRLKGVLTEYEAKESLPLEELVDLQGILEDAVRVASDIGNFLEKKERIKAFEEATKDTQSLDREILVMLLKEKRSSKIY